MKMAGSFESQAQSQKEKGIMAVNGIIQQWEVQYARFILYPPLSSLSAAAQHPSVAPHSTVKRKCSSGVWISSSSSSSVSSAAVSASSATLKLIGDCSIGSGDAILNVSLRGKVLEEHYISQLHFSWPQVSCLSGFPARGARFVFLSFKDPLGQVQKFALRFVTVQETEKLVHLLQKIMEDPEPEDLLHAEHISEISSQSEFVPSAELSHRLNLDPEIRAEEGCRNTISADNCGNQTPAAQNKDVAQLPTTEEAMPNSQTEERLSEYPPSFTSFMMNCCPSTGQEKSKGSDEAELRSLVARYLKDSSFQDMFNKVEKAINELGHNIL